MIKENIKDLQREKKDSEFLNNYLMLVIELRNINHYLMDLVLNDIKIEKNNILKVIKTLDQMADFNENNSAVIKPLVSQGIEELQLRKIITGINQSIHLLKGVK